LRLFARHLVVGPVSLRVLGIGGLFTVPEFRGKNLAIQVIRYAMTTLEKNCVGLVANGEDRKDSIFLKAGFSRFGRSLTGPRQALYLWTTLGVEMVSEPDEWHLRPETPF
jgi:hypothetical protein